MVGHLLLACAVVGLSSSAIYLVLVLIATRRFCSQRRRAAASEERNGPFPPVTVLKPLRGMEPLLEQSLGSFFQQDYPTFEIIFGARSKDDPALQIVNALRQKNPAIKTKVVLSGEPRYPNAKVFALERMLAAASHSYLVITDSDVRVSADYLKHVVPPLLDSGVGMVTCIYRGVSTGGLWSRLEALGMSVEMSSGVLVADMLEGMKFALGPTMATRKDVLEKLGGIRVLADYCADDFVLGRLAYEAGKKVVLSRHIIDHVVLNRSARQSILHQARWMKSTRFSRPLGHVGSCLTYVIPFGLLGMAAGLVMGNWVLALGLLGVAILKSVIQCLVVGLYAVRDRASWGACWLYPARDLLGFCLWGASFLGSEIEWRGERYQLTAGGRMIRKSPPPGRMPQTAEAVKPRGSSASVAVDRLP